MIIHQQRILLLYYTLYLPYCCFSVNDQIETPCIVILTPPTSLINCYALKGFILLMGSNTQLNTESVCVSKVMSTLNYV